MTNQYLLLLTLLIGLCVACNSQNTPSMNTFEWAPTNTTPVNYPVYLYRGYFMGADSSIISTPDRRTLYYGWQNIGGGYISGSTLKPAPQELQLLWLSYAENRYYRAQIDLPAAKIEALFEEGFIDAWTRKKETYDSISYGIAPGGFVAVWVIGAGHRVEVATGRGEPTEVDFNEMIPGSGQTQQEHIKSRLETHVEDSVVAQIREGSIPYGRWETTYRTKYRWSPAMTHQAEDFTPLTVEMNFFNGEQAVQFYDRPQVETDPRKPVPTYFRLEWRDARENLYAARVYFDEAEIYGAFEQGAPEAGGQELRLVARIARYNDEVTLRLVAGQTRIPLAKTRVKIYPKKDED